MAVNESTGDRLVSKKNSKEGNDRFDKNYDGIFRNKPKTDKPTSIGQGTKRLIEAEGDCG